MFATDDWNGGPQKSITLRVPYPEFLPYLPSTKECMERKKRCVIIEMHVSKAGRLSDISISDNNFEDHQNKKLANKEYNYDVYTIGVPSALTKYYRNKNEKIYFHCIHVGNRGAASCRIIGKYPVDVPKSLDECFELFDDSRGVSSDNQEHVGEWQIRRVVDDRSYFQRYLTFDLDVHAHVTFAGNLEGSPSRDFCIWFEPLVLSHAKIADFERIGGTEFAAGPELHDVLDKWQGAVFVHDIELMNQPKGIARCGGVVKRLYTLDVCSTIRPERTNLPPALFTEVFPFIKYGEFGSFDRGTGVGNSQVVNGIVESTPEVVDDPANCNGPVLRDWIDGINPHDILAGVSIAFDPEGIRLLLKPPINFRLQGFELNVGASKSNH
jgi:hypothetical protein